MILTRGDLVEYRGPIQGMAASVILCGDILSVVEQRGDGTTLVALPGFGSRTEPQVVRSDDLRLLMRA